MRIYAIATVSLLAGCIPDWGSVPSPHPLSEAYLADPSNCWATAVTQWATSIPQHAMTATLSTDRSTCTFPDGVVVRFDQPVPADAPQPGELAFDVDDTQCDDCGGNIATASFSGAMGSDGLFTGNISDGFSISASALGTASITIYPNPQYELTCGDIADNDERYATTPKTVDTWPSQVVPNFALSIDAASIAFTLDSVDSAGQLFTCAP
jgi:hypothetical protein